MRLPKICLCHLLWSKVTSAIFHLSLSEPISITADGPLCEFSTLLYIFNIYDFRGDDGASVCCHAFSFCMNKSDIDLFREGSLLTDDFINFAFYGYTTLLSFELIQRIFPFFSFSPTTSKPASEVRSNGVLPLLSVLLGSDPLSRRSWTLSRSPFSAASCSGVYPLLSVLLGSAPLSRRSWPHLCDPSLQHSVEESIHLHLPY